jgi:sensor domain CHASE-containing protein
MLEHVSASTVPPGQFSRRVILPVAGLVAGAIALVLAFVLISAVRQDRIALEASTSLARTALAVKEREIARNLKDYAVWEDAYKNLHLDLNVEWAATDGNVGANILNSLGYELAFVVAPGGETVYAVVDGEPTQADALALFPIGLRPILREAAEDPDPVVGLLQSGPDIVMVAATALLPPSGLGVGPPPNARSTLIFAKKLNAAFLDRIERQYLLDDLELIGAGESGSGAALPLITPDGTPLGEIAWRPDRPGRELLRIVLPPLLLALLGLAMFASLVLRNAKRSASDIEASARTIQAYAQTLEQAKHGSGTWPRPRPTGFGRQIRNSG